jgi:hypothetical protein
MVQSEKAGIELEANPNEIGDFDLEFQTAECEAKTIGTVDNEGKINLAI